MLYNFVNIVNVKLYGDYIKKDNILCVNRILGIMFLS